MELKLCKYRPEYFDAMMRFLSRAYPDREHPEEYLRYTLSDRGGEQIGRHTSIVLHDQEIVGVNMYLPAQVCIQGKTVDTLWSYETKVLDEYRESDAGMLLMSEYCGLPNTFSAGLSSIAADLNRRIRSKFIGGSTAFLRPNFRSLDRPVGRDRTEETTPHGRFSGTDSGRRGRFPPDRFGRRNRTAVGSVLESADHGVFAESRIPAMEVFHIARSLRRL